jgi:O-antigen ligase
MLFLFAGLSILWSDFPGVSFKRWIKAIGNPIMVLVVLTDHSPIEALKTLLRRFAYVLVPLSIVLIKYFPELGRTYHRYTDEAMFTGVATGKNGLGLLCLVSGLYFFWNLLTMWRNKTLSVDKKEAFINILFLLMIAWLLTKADSATALVTLIIGISIIAAFELKTIRRNAGRIGLYMLIFLLCISPFLVFGSSSILTSFVDITGHSDTFWGRVEMWPEFIDMMEASPLIGSGYDSFWLGDRMAILWDKYWWHPTEAHNGYVETYLELGWIGVFLLVGIIVSAFINARKVLNSDFEFGRFAMAFLLIALAYNVTESAFKGLHLMWFVFLLVTIQTPHTDTALLSSSDSRKDFHLD